MNDSEQIVIKAFELLKVGRQAEYISLMNQAAKMGHPAGIFVVEYLKDMEKKKNEFPVNSLCIVDDPQLNSENRIKDSVSRLQSDISVNLYRLQTLNNGLTSSEICEMLIYFALDNLIEYKNKALNILPYIVIQDLTKQIKEAFTLAYINHGDLDTILANFESQLMKEIWEIDIEERAIQYNEKLDNKHFF